MFVLKKKNLTFPWWIACQGKKCEIYKFARDFSCVIHASDNQPLNHWTTQLTSTFIDPGGSFAKWRPLLGEEKKSLNLVFLNTTSCFCFWTSSYFQKALSSSSKWEKILHSPHDHYGRPWCYKELLNTSWPFQKPKPGRFLNSTKPQKLGDPQVDHNDNPSMLGHPTMDW